MPKTNRKQIPKKKGKSSTTTITRPRSTAKSVPRNLVRQACGLTDPFCHAAMAAKYPDDSSARTLPYTYKFSFPVGTDANGEAALLWHPQYAYSPLVYSSTRTGPDVSTWNNFSPATLLAGVSKYRIVSSGLRIQSIVAPLNASGRVSLRSYGVEPSNLFSVNVLGFNSDSQLDVPLRLTDDVVAVTSHSDRMPQTFYSVASDSVSIASMPQSGFNPATIYVSGAPPSTSVLYLEGVIHYELIFEDTSGLAQAATPAPPANSLLTQAANRLSSTLPTFFERGLRAVSDMIEKRALSALGGFIGGPAGAIAPILMLD